MSNPYELLADKILEGCQISEPIRNRFTRREHGVVFACALGAAAISCNPKASGRNNLVKLLNECTGVNFDLWVVSPASGWYSGSLWNVIISLNDSSGWSRERIAKWVRGLPWPNP